MRRPLLAAAAFLAGVTAFAGTAVQPAAAKTKPATAALTTTYKWSSSVQIPFKTSAGTVIATLAFRWEIANNGVCRHIYAVQWAPSQFYVDEVVVNERYPSGSDMETGYVWTGGTTAGHTSGALTLSQEPCIDDTKRLQIHVKIWRTASIATYADYAHDM